MGRQATRAELRNDKIVRLKLRRIGEAIPKQHAKAIVVAAFAIVKDAKAKVPVKSGKLKRNITIEVIRAGRKTTVKAGVRRGVLYDKRIEFGFKGTDSLGRRYNQRAQPYLFPALKKNRARTKGLIIASTLEGFGKLTK